MVRNIYQVLIISGILVNGGYAFADSKIKSVNLAKDGIYLNDAQVHVKPVNGKYGQPTKQTVSYHVKMKAACHNENIIKKADVYFGKVSITKKSIEANSNYSKPANLGAKKSSLWVGVTLNVPLSKLGVNPVNACKNLMNQKLSQGVSASQFLASSHVINKNVTLTAVAGCGKFYKAGKDQYKKATLPAKLEIICKAGTTQGIGGILAPKPKPPFQNIKAKSLVTGLTFAPVKKHYTGLCPKALKFKGSITMSGPGTAKYRIAFPGIAQTGWKLLKFNKAGTRNIQVAVFSAKQTFKQASATLEVKSPNVKKAYAKFKVTCVNVELPASNIQAPGAPKRLPKRQLSN